MPQTERPSTEDLELPPLDGGAEEDASIEAEEDVAVSAGEDAAATGPADPA